MYTLWNTKIDDFSPGLSPTRHPFDQWRRQGAAAGGHTFLEKIAGIHISRRIHILAQ